MSYYDNGLPMCDCEQVNLPVGASSLWCDGTTHTETACIGDQR